MAFDFEAYMASLTREERAEIGRQMWEEDEREREDCPAAHLTFTRTDAVAAGNSTTPGARDLRMDCADCGTWAILRYHPDYTLDRLYERLADLAPGRHTAPFVKFVLAVHVQEEMLRELETLT